MPLFLSGCLRYTKFSSWNGQLEIVALLIQDTSLILYRVYTTVTVSVQCTLQQLQYWHGLYCIALRPFTRFVFLLSYKKPSQKLVLTRAIEGSEIGFSLQSSQLNCKKLASPVMINFHDLIARSHYIGSFDLELNFLKPISKEILLFIRFNLIRNLISSNLFWKAILMILRRLLGPT